MKRIDIIGFLQREQKILLGGMRAYQDDGGGRILLGDNRAAGRSYCNGSGAGVLEFGYQSHCLVRTYAESACTACRINYDLRKIELSGRNYCIRRGRSVLSVFFLI
jgi:hypothetical protein